MNVLHICDYASTIPGNFIEEMTALDSALRESMGGRNIYIFTDRNIERKNKWIDDLAKDYPVYIYDKNPLHQIKLFREVIKKHNVDLIHVHFTTMKNDMCIDIAALGRKVKIIKHYRSAYGIFSKFKKSIGRIVYKKWFLICVAPAMEDEAKINFPTCKTNVILNSIAFSRLEKYEKLDKHSITGDDSGTLCFMLGYNYKLKGIDLAADAVSKLRDKYNLYLAVCVTTHLDEIKEELKKQFGGEIPSWLKLLPPRNDIASYYHVADLCLSPSRSEGSCTAAVEEAYCGKIIVASKCPGQYSYLNGKLDVLWFENKNSDDLKDKIEEALKLAETAPNMEKNTINAVKYYGLDTYTEQVIQTYKSL